MATYHISQITNYSLWNKPFALKAFPENLFPNGGAVYIIFVNGVPRYVGQTEDIHRRIQDYQGFRTNNLPLLLALMVDECSMQFIYADEDLLRQGESMVYYDLVAKGYSLFNDPTKIQNPFLLNFMSPSL